MTTTIQPATGAAPLYTQQGVGTTPGYAALDDRRANVGPMQAGVYGTSTLVTAGGVASVAAADFMVTQRNAGANMSVDINMPGGGFAWVQGTTINGQGLYCVPSHSVNINELIAAADPTNPRVDQVILEVQDNVIDASGGNLARTRVISGVPQAGATLTNRLGTPALPGNCLLLADLLVPVGAASIPNTNIRDRRKWARGTFARIVRTSAAYSTVSTSLVAVDAANVSSRVECSGAPLRVSLHAWGNNSTASDGVATGINLDGFGIDGTSDLMQMASPAAGQAFSCSISYVTTPTPGSHVLTPTFRANLGGTATLEAVAGAPLVFTVEELVRQNVANNTVTSG